MKLNFLSVLLLLSGFIFAQNAIDVKSFDKSIAPDVDFFKYINNNWLKNTPIPESESRWGSFNELIESNREILKQIIHDCTKNTTAKKGSNEQLVGDFYTAGMDTIAIEKAGLSPIQNEMNAINAIKTTADVERVMYDLHKAGFYALYGFSVQEDLKNSKIYASYLGQGGLGLPERSYYLENNERMNGFRKSYTNYLSKILELSGTNKKEATKMAAAILIFETALAKISRSSVENRDIQKSYNKKSIAELQKLSPNFHWQTYLNVIGAQNAKEIIVAQPEFFEGISKLLSTTSIPTWKAYLKTQVLSNVAPYLSKKFRDTHFAFYNAELQGVKIPKPRWKDISDLVDYNVGTPLGHLYVDKAFPPKAKMRMEEMIGNIREAMLIRLLELDWMSGETKLMAMEKLKAITYKIGYPDKWKDYSSLDIRRDDFLGNMNRCTQFELKKQMEKIGKEVDKSEWGMTPPTVNAYYNPTGNEIVFPAGILQPPFFNMNADDAVNYGGIGAVIAHELTHGFDDQGAQFDKEGNLTNWWSEEDMKRFETKTNRIIKQFDAYTMLDTMHVQGALTVGENIADLGGVTIAFEAMKKSWKKKGKQENIDGLTPEQRFCVNWAQVWKYKARDAEVVRRLKVDPHSPGYWRANGTMMNFPPFFEAFNVKEGSKMRLPSDKITVIW